MDLSDLSAKLGLLPAVVICSPETAFYRIHEGNSIHSVPPFIKNLYRLLQKEKAGEYPGGEDCRRDRQVWFGGLIAFWIRRAAGAGLYRDAARLALTGWRMALAAVLQRAVFALRGRREIETLTF